MLQSTETTEAKIPRRCDRRRADERSLRGLLARRFSTIGRAMSRRSRRPGDDAALR